MALAADSGGATFRRRTRLTGPGPPAPRGSGPRGDPSAEPQLAQGVPPKTFAGRPGVARSTWKTDPACGHSASVSAGRPCVALVMKSVPRSEPPKAMLVG